MPISRRNLFGRAGAIAAAASLPGCTLVSPAAASIRKAAPYVPAPDPIFAALNRWQGLESQFNATLDELSKAQSSLLALGHGFRATVAHPQAPYGTCSTHEQIALCFAVDRTGAQGPQALVDAAEALAHAELDRRAALIADTRETLGIRELEARERELSDATNDALREALSTKPTSLAGLVELMKVFVCQASIFSIDPALETGPETMLAALRDLFPVAQEARS